MMWIRGGSMMMKQQSTYARLQNTYWTIHKYGQRHSVAYLHSQKEGYRVEDHCKISNSMYSEGYPLQDGANHPRRSRKKK